MIAMLQWFLMLRRSFLLCQARNNKYPHISCAWIYGFKEILIPDTISWTPVRTFLCWHVRWEKTYRICQESFLTAYNRISFSGTLNFSIFLFFFFFPYGTLSPSVFSNSSFQFCLFAGLFWDSRWKLYTRANLVNHQERLKVWF